MRSMFSLMAAAAIVAPMAALAADHTVLFAHDSSRLDSAAMTTIDQVAADYAATGETSLSVVGHTDTTGSAEYNEALSERRARAVIDALVARGVPASSMTAAWRGESEPAVMTADGVREPLNRRVEISVSAPSATPVPATVEDVLMGLRVGIGPYVAYNFEEGDESVFLGGNLTISYDITDMLSVSAEQAVFWNLDADDEGVGSRTVAGLELNFGDAGGVEPFVGVNGGYMAIDGSGTGGWLGGPELGVRFNEWEMKAAYDFVEDRDAEDGVLSLTVGYNFNF